jgi:hypothetical protein
MPGKIKAGFVTGFLIVSVLFTAWTGYTSMAAPARFAQPLGYALVGLDGRNEIRAQYGGFFLAVAVSGVLALAGRIPRSAALLVNVILFGGLIGGRLISLAVDGRMDGYSAIIRALFFIDSTGFLLSIAALSAERFKVKPD